MVQLIADYSLHMVTSPMCAFGMVIRDGHGEDAGLARKETTWLSNSSEIVNALTRRCSGDHSHANLFGGRACQAQVYPPALCRAIVDGLKAQIAKDTHLMGMSQGLVREEPPSPATLLQTSDAWSATTRGLVPSR